MNSSPPSLRCRAVSMELAAYLDGHYVEMHILTDAGQTVSIECQRDSIFAVQRHIEQMARDCPEIATWQAAANVEAVPDDVYGSYKRPMLAGAAATTQEGRRTVRPLAVGQRMVASVRRWRTAGRAASILILAAGLGLAAGCSTTIVQDDGVEQTNTNLCQGPSGLAPLSGVDGQDRA